MIRAEDDERPHPLQGSPRKYGRARFGVTWSSNVKLISDRLVDWTDARVLAMRAALGEDPGAPGDEDGRDRIGTARRDLHTARQGHGSCLSAP